VASHFLKNAHKTVASYIYPPRSKAPATRKHVVSLQSVLPIYLPQCKFLKYHDGFIWRRWELLYWQTTEEKKKS